MDATEYQNKILLLGTFFTAIHHTRKAKDYLTLLRPEVNGQDFAGDNFKCIFFF